MDNPILSFIFSLKVYWFRVSLANPTFPQCGFIIPKGSSFKKIYNNNLYNSNSVTTRKKTLVKNANNVTRKLNNRSFARKSCFVSASYGEHPKNW